MNNIILKKKRGEELSTEEINYFIDNYTKGNIPDYQASALLMAICFNHLNKRETFDLTMAMANSGDLLCLDKIKHVTADKHSTGGVGDKTTLVVGPICAANGVAIAKMSGRGLGHTGGTIDKLESIKGFKTDLNNEEFVDIVNKVLFSNISQSLSLAPADKLLYALRDVTATVDEISLIASSIMSKKIAAGAHIIVLDVKTGSGAFMKTLEDSKLLAKEMVDIGISSNREMFALLSDMNQPLGFAIGNRLEVLEAVKALKGDGPEDFMDSCLYLSALILKGAKLVNTVDEGIIKAKETIESGKAYDKFIEFVSAQHGDISDFEDLNSFIKVNKIYEIKSNYDGYICSMNTEEIGFASMLLGGGRQKKDDIIDPNVGIIMNKKLGDYCKEGDILGCFYVNDESRLEEAIKRFKNAFKYCDSKEKTKHKHIYGYYDGTNFVSLN